MSPTERTSPASPAKALVLLLAVAWGLNWVASRITLTELPPLGSRFISLAGGSAVLFAIAFIGRRRLRIPRGQWIHVAIAGFFNVAAFNVLNANALLAGNASRAVVIAYSMPIWSALLARFFLGERLTPIRLIALALCAAGLTVLIWPLARDGIPLSAIYSLGCALVWAAGTVYMKRAVVDAEPMSLAAWQLLFGWSLVAIGTVIVEGLPHVGSLQPLTILALVYNGVIGFGLAYSLWFAIVERLPAITASLGSLLVPIVGIAASMVLLGERPTPNDLIGFALIFTAAACILLQPTAKHTELPE